MELPERRRIAVLFAVGWAAVGAAIALSALPNVNDDAKLLVGLASVAFPLCALGAAASLRRRPDRLAGFLLLLSVATPTYMAFALNLPALVLGTVLLVAPRFVRGPVRA